MKDPISSVNTSVNNNNTEMRSPGIVQPRLTNDKFMKYIITSNEDLDENNQTKKVMDSSGGSERLLL